MSETMRSSHAAGAANDTELVAGREGAEPVATTDFPGPVDTRVKVVISPNHPDLRLFVSDQDALVWRHILKIYGGQQKLLTQFLFYILGCCSLHPSELLPCLYHMLGNLACSRTSPNHGIKCSIVLFAVPDLQSVVPRSQNAHCSPPQALWKLLGVAACVSIG